METEEYLKKLVTDFPTYLQYVYHYIGLPETTPLQGRIATIMNGLPNRYILEAARGTGKSYIGAIYSTWRLLRNVDEKILIVSASGPKAIEIATFVRSLFDNVPLLQHLTPGPTERDSVLSFDVKGSKVSIAPSVSAVGITSQITGKRATFILADDVEVPSNSMTELMREKLVARVNEFEALLIPDMPSSILFLGTPQSMESIYNKLEYPTTILPAQVPEDEGVYEGKLDPWILQQGQPGEATDKVRFPIEVLRERQAGMGVPMYKLQYMLDTTLSDAERYPLKTVDSILLPLSKETAPATIQYTRSQDYMRKDIVNLGFTGDRFQKPFSYSDRHMKYDLIAMGIDPSGSGADETAYAIVGVLSGNVYVLDFGGTRKGFSDEALMFLARKAEEYKVNKIIPEKNYGSGMFTELFKKVLNEVYSCYIEEDFRVSGQKEKRIIDNIAPILTNHQLIFNEDSVIREAEWVQSSPADNLQYSLMYQMTHITYDRGSLVHDDRLDALAIVLQYVADMVIVSDKKRLEMIKEKEMEEFLHNKVYNTTFRPFKPRIIGQYRSLSKKG